MSYRNKILSLWKLIRNNFLFPFWTGIYFILFCLSILNKDSIFSSVLITWSFLGVILMKILENEYSNAFSKSVQYLKPVLISTLLIIIIDNFSGNDFFSSFNLIIPIFSLLLLSASLIIFFSKDFEWTIKSRIKHNTKILFTLFLLTAAVFFFTAIKLPFFDKSFTGEHTMKYNSYVEPAQHMVQRGSPFILQKKYLADPVSNPEGQFSYFSGLPLEEWGLAAVYKLFPNNSLEFNTRLFTHLVGILILCLTFFFLRKQFTVTQNLMTIFLLVINPLFTFTTFVTVGESLLIIFTLASLIFLENFFQNKKLKTLFMVALLSGVGLAIKQSIIVWMLPIVIISLYIKRDSIQNFLRDSVFFCIISFLPFITFFTSIRLLPTYLLVGILSFLSWTIIYIAIYYNIDFLAVKFLNKNVSRLIIIGCSFATLTLLASLFFDPLHDAIFLNEFVTDPKLLLNGQFYYHILFNQIQSYNGSLLFFSGLLGCLLVLLRRSSAPLLQSIFFGCLIYFLVASKTIFFHNYYTVIISIMLCMCSAYFFYAIARKFNFIDAGIILLSAGILIFFNSHEKTIQYLAKEKRGFVEAAQYLTEHTNSTDIFIDDSYTLSLTIKTGRATVGSAYYLLDSDITKSVREMGFARTMEKYDIKYLVTTDSEPNYPVYVGIFSGKNERERDDYDRTLIIENRLAGNFEANFEDKEAVIKYNLPNKFRLETRIGDYRFYTFQN